MIVRFLCYKKSAYSFIKENTTYLLSSLLLLIWGTIQTNAMIRKASLVVILLTIGKVFLYDASALEGLLRVFSFLGLGLSLLSLSWFYMRYIFTEDTKQ